ncbi:MAG: circadian clock KaiB family protein [Myxococcales bacterium]|nr:circadian clock KaiB family protein [Myxococcales bacterium]
MKYVLRLYITAQSGHSERAVRNLRAICESALAGRYDLEVIDVLEDPNRADQDKVLATPTLIRRLPLPTRRLVGDLSDRARVIAALDIEPDDTRGEGGAK